jgi:tetratricopeptide (TPR) repeat protein
VVVRIRSTVCCFILAAGLAGGATPAQAPADLEDEYFRLVRRAVTDEDEEALYELARNAPWAFREVANHLADLAIRQVGEEEPSDAVGGFTRYIISGHLASIYWQVTEDPTLAERLRRMRDWSPEDMREWRGAIDLLEQVTAATPPRPRQLEKALGVCRRLGDLRCTGMIQGALGDLVLRAGQRDAAILHFEKAAEALREAGEMPRLRDALVARGQVLLGLGRYGGAAEDLGAAAAISGQVDDKVGRIGALLILAEALDGDGRRQRAFEVLSEARDAAFQDDLPGFAARAIIMRTRMRDPEGSLPSSAIDYEAAARLAEQAGDLDTVARAYLNAARIHAAAGEDARGAEVIEKAISAIRLSDSERGLEVMLMLAGELHARLEDWDRAVNRIREADRLLESKGDREGMALAREALGTTLLEAGRRREAVEPLGQAAALARESGLLLVEGRVEGALGALALAEGDPETARRHYDRSVELLERGGDRFEARRMRMILEGLAARRGPDTD